MLLRQAQDGSPLIILNQDLRVITASHSFYEFFNVTPHETVGQLIYELGNKQWDITERKHLEAEKARLEARNRQLQKAESLGRMAGSVSHHFNNKLSVVMGYLEMVIGDLPSPEPYISADAKQVQKILAGLVTINASEAIGEEPGTVRLRIKTVPAADIPESYRRPIGWKSREQHYACLEVTDSGCGIREVLKF